MGVFYAGSQQLADRQTKSSERFQGIVVDSTGPVEPWGKCSGDINGDGLPDLVVGGHGPSALSLNEHLRTRNLGELEGPDNGELVWYENPTWRKHVISGKYRFSTDCEVADIDGDGRNDVISITKSGLVWFKNPDWTPTIIDSTALHDIEVADLDGDGDLDIVARNQSRFNYNDGNRLYIYRQDSPSQWQHFTIDSPHGEGVKVADINGDGKPDIIVNSCWYQNPGHLESSALWPEKSYSSTWSWPDVFIDVADINKDGRLDIVLAPAEPQGKRYRISWFEAPGSNDSEWLEHIIDPDVESVHHFIAARDMDNDGNVDIVTAEMHQGNSPHDIAVYWGSAAIREWVKEVIATTGSHSMRVVDIDNDGDFDLFGANWSGEYQPVELWVNQTRSKLFGKWRRHVIDSDKPWKSVFIIAADLDKDGYKDIVTGGWWYRNPGDPAGKWVRHAIGAPANNVAIIYDFDKDGSLDLLSSHWRDGTEWNLYERIMRKMSPDKHPLPVQGGFAWARNDGKGNFQIINNIATAQGDFLQGAAAISNRGSEQIALSWHESGKGIQMLIVPDNPAQDSWTWKRLSDMSQDEELSIGDIDGDGYPDLMLGTKWLRNEDRTEWSIHDVHPGNHKPDRNRLVDMNRDGKLDVVVGCEAISVPGKVAWYEQGSDAEHPWMEHIIGTAIGPMSLDVGDIDGDGDIDVLVGEHNLQNPESSRLILFENMDGHGYAWKRHVIYTGDEHHDGTQFVDIDNDGDLDVISIGWSHGKVIIYENMN